MLQTFIFFRVWECNKEPQFFDFLGVYFFQASLDWLFTSQLLSPPTIAAYFHDIYILLVNPGFVGQLTVFIIVLQILSLCPIVKFPIF
jgi:hypothetical protein